MLPASILVIEFGTLLSSSWSNPIDFSYPLLSNNIMSEINLKLLYFMTSDLDLTVIAEIIFFFIFFFNCFCFFRTDII